MTTERQKLIIKIIRERGLISFEDLAAHLSVTPAAARRLANQLCEQGLLRRTHGGVCAPSSNRNLAYENRKSLNLAAKQLIAQAVADSIPDGASVIIGPGTTPECVALALAARSHFRIFTNSLNAAAAFAHNPATQITMASGTLRAHERDIIGDAAVQFFCRYKADYGLFGVSGIDEDGSLLDFYEEELQARQAIVANCRTTVLVADGSKFGSAAMVRGGHLGDCQHIFTDRMPPANFRHLAERYADRLHIAGERLDPCA